uniref:ubiquitin-conjugating enzyme E2 27-like n=1 Tax=Erigeron canadensis TaxID=72917 RepID=UPI001CB92DC7|nr:ubiquitin-conjugating enzyme E2 27-like [Erigeron canadensis]
MVQELRIQRELQNVVSDESLVGITLQREENDIHHLTATIIGPESTPYEGGLFRLDINLPVNYPFAPPVVRFVTKTWHPNISNQNGDVSMNTLKGDWSPGMNLKTVLISIQALLSSPELSEAQNAEVALQYLRNHSTFIRNAWRWTQIYATNIMPPPHLTNRTAAGRRMSRKPARFDDFLL